MSQDQPKTKLPSSVAKDHISLDEMKKRAGGKDSKDQPLEEGTTSETSYTGGGIRG